MLPPKLRKKVDLTRENEQPGILNNQPFTYNPGQNAAKGFDTNEIT